MYVHGECVELCEAAQAAEQQYDQPTTLHSLNGARKQVGGQRLKVLRDGEPKVCRNAWDKYISRCAKLRDIPTLLMNEAELQRKAGGKGEREVPRDWRVAGRQRDTVHWHSIATPAVDRRRRCATLC